MVVFTCSYCGDSVNKPKVDKHYQTRCRGRVPNLSCMDCFKDFYGGAHESHTKCISEEQRYGGVGFVPSAKKGESKQETWVQLVQQALDNNTSTSKQVTRILQEVIKHSNTPRKKPKFINFVKNVCGHRTMPSDIDAAWNILAKQLDNLRQNNSQQLKQTSDKVINVSKINGQVEHAINVTNGEGKIEESEKRQQKRHKAKQDSQESATNNIYYEKDQSAKDHCKATNEIIEGDVEENKQCKFKWRKRMQSVVEKKGGTIKLKKMIKIVLKEYTRETGLDPDERIRTKLLNKLTTSNSLHLKDNTVSLVI